MVAVSGTKGGIKVKPFSGDPSGILSARKLRLSGGDAPEGREYEVRTARPSGGCAVFSLEGIGSAEAARSLAGARVFVPRGDLPPPGEDEYYCADLVGCVVIDADGRSLGEVSGVVPGPAHDWIEVRGSWKEDALLPLVAQFIREVDTAGRRIVVSPPEGWPNAG